MKSSLKLNLSIFAYAITVMLLTLWLIGTGVPFAMGMFGMALVGGILLIAYLYNYHSGIRQLWFGRNNRAMRWTVGLVFLALYVALAGLTTELLFGDERFVLPISDVAMLGVFLVATIAWLAHLVKQARYDRRKGRHAPGRGQ